ncbi:MAG: serine/threonine protein kinase [Acidobacteria bacterium]|nr:MAG: serine/threonine protein kinase [Acidobacteriota bacterium]RPJ84813.1 MAG: serine/threonine protein kinase [Acidobacteriota bacterium]
MARSALAGLVAAHEAGVVHRDLKPANVMIAEGGEALIMDFGIARSSGPPTVAGRQAPANRAVADADPGHTVAGSIVGTLQYMAPEQSRGEEVDQRADVYAFGLILYDMLSGRRRLNQPGTAFEEFQSRLEAPPPGLHSVDQAIPEALERVVTRCLQPDAAARYQTSRDLAAELDRLDQDGRPLPVVRRIGLPVVAAFSLLLLLAGIAFWQASRTPPPAPAERDPVSVLVADFDNRAGDPLFTSTLEQALSVGIEGAPFVMSFSRPDAARLAASMKPGSHLDAAMARLVAVREGVALVLAGRIDAVRDGSYSISVQALNPSDGRQMWIESTTVEGKDRVLAGIVRGVSEVREALGDTTPEADRAASVESFTTTSLEALRDYTAAQERAAAGRYEEAIDNYRRSLEHDSQLGRAHSGWATAAFYLGRKEEAEAHWKQALALMDRMSEREKYRTLGTYYLGIARNYEQAIENYRELVRRYPTDLAGHNNLAFAYFSVLDFPAALQEGLRARDLYPRNVVIGNNYALYAMYAGDFDAAAAEARRLIADHPSFYKNYLPLAAAAVAADDYETAAEAYRQMATTGAQGASLARMGRADLAMYRGLYRDAQAVLTEGAKEDARSGETIGQAMKLTALSESYVEMGQRAAALAASRQALSLSRQEPVVVPTARLLIRLGRREEAAALAAELSRKLEVQSRAYGRILEGDLAAAGGRVADAVDAYRAGIALADLWLARLRLGVTYVEAGYFAEALAELEACNRRRGEATAVFLDDTPSFRYLATLPYWLGRAQEGLGQVAASRASYEKLLATRTGAPDDGVVSDARRRLGK